MAKSVDLNSLDAALTDIRTNSTHEVLCSAQPTTYAEANVTYSLAQVALAAAGADITLANGDTNGRKATIAAKAGAPVASNGTGNHVALIDKTNLRLKLVTTVPSQAVSAGGTVDFGSWKYEQNLPT